MCMFSGTIEIVHDTQIFARMDEDDQLLVYSMSVGTSTDVAMILPIPTPVGVADDAVSFIDLSECPGFFKALSQYFTAEPVASFASAGAAVTLAAPTLVVHEVGSFEASFVPKLADFGRLDKRFRLSDEIWGKLPQYADYGFAVFKLKAEKNAPVHPMAFRFPSRNPSRLFFPTLHVHDETVPNKARFDHVLYCQGAPKSEARWERSLVPIQETEEWGEESPVSRGGQRVDDLADIELFDLEETPQQNGATDPTTSSETGSDAPEPVRENPTTPPPQPFESGTYNLSTEPGFTTEKTKGVVCFKEPAWKQIVSGKRKNEDFMVNLSS